MDEGRIGRVELAVLFGLVSEEGMSLLRWWLWPLKVLKSFPNTLQPPSPTLLSQPTQ